MSGPCVFILIGGSIHDLSTALHQCTRCSFKAVGCPGRSGVDLLRCSMPGFETEGDEGVTQHLVTSLLTDLVTKNGGFFPKTVSK